MLACIQSTSLIHLLHHEKRPTTTDRENGHSVQFDTVSREKGQKMKTSYSAEIMGFLEKIRVHHTNVTESEKQVAILKKRTVEDALICGEYLTKCKEELPHGAWGEFIKTEFRGCFCQKTAGRYMKLFVHRDVVIKYSSLKEAYIELDLIKDVSWKADWPLENQTFIDDAVGSEDEDPPAPKAEFTVSEPPLPNIVGEELPVTVEVGAEDDPTKPLDHEVPPNNVPQVETPVPSKRTPKTSGFMIVFRPTVRERRVLGKPIIEYRLKADGGVEGFNMTNGESIQLYPQDLDDFFEAVRPFVDWFEAESKRRSTIDLQDLKEVPVSLDEMERLLAA